MLSINKKKQIQQLSQKKHRDEQSRFVVEGAKIVNDLIVKGLQPIIIVGYADIIAKSNLNRCNTEIIECSESEMRSISQFKTPSPLLAVFEKPDYSSALKRPSDLTLILDEIQDPGNLGTIVRIADWFGIRQIICSDTCADIFGPKAVQATMGAIARVAVVETNLDAYLERNQREWNIPVFGTFLEGDNIYKSDLPQVGFIVMGNEGKGICDKLKPFVNRKLFIPNYPAGSLTSESLNVAAATAIVCSEFRRR